MTHAEKIEVIPDYAKDTKINVANVLTPEGAPGLTQGQIDGIVLAVAYASKSADAVQWALSRASETLTREEKIASKAAASIMAMNNVYYRFLHLADDADYQAMPARLRMTVIGNPGIDKAVFELYALAVSAVNGCGFCVASHAKKLVSSGYSKDAVQSVVRVASVTCAVAQSFFNESVIS